MLCLCSHPTKVTFGPLTTCGLGATLRTMGDDQSKLKGKEKRRTLLVVHLGSRRLHVPCAVVPGT